MRTSINLGTSALTPSGTGEECFRIKPPRKPGQPWALWISDGQGNSVDVVMDERHLSALQDRLVQTSRAGMGV